MTLTPATPLAVTFFCPPPPPPPLTLTPQPLPCLSLLPPPPSYLPAPPFHPLPPLSRCPPLVPATPTTVVVGHMGAGAGYTCGLLDDGSVKCWGLNMNGELGLGDYTDRGSSPGQMGDGLSAVSLGSGRTAEQLTCSVSGHHTCGLLDNGDVKCWGYNLGGQLGLGDQSSRGSGPGQMGDSLPAVPLGSGHTVVAVAAGGYHSCALLDNGSVKCWGSNWNGQLGLGDTVNRGLIPGQMGDMLPVVSLGVGRTAAALTAGEEFTCALLDNGSVKCWGLNGIGELGIGDYVNRGSSPGQMGDMLPAVPLGSGRTAVAVAAGYEHSCALLDDGGIKCWGTNDYGQLGLGDTAGRGGAPGRMGDMLPAVDLGTAVTVRAVSCGTRHTCVLLEGGGIKCWGDNSHGGLGIGDVVNRGDSPGHMGDSLPVIALGTGRTALSLVAGSLASCAVLDDGGVKCWGYNGAGWLGYGDSVERGASPGQMGDALPSVALGTGRTISLLNQNGA